MALTAYTQALHSNLSLKITAFIIGYSLWAALSNTHTTEISYRVPITFYNLPKNCSITSPDFLDVTLMGKKAQLRSLKPATLAIHIDGASLKQGENHIGPSTASLFLPEQIDVVNYTPSHLVIYVDSQAHAKEMAITT